MINDLNVISSIYLFLIKGNTVRIQVHVVGNGAQVNLDHNENEFDNPGECEEDTELILTKEGADQRCA